MLKRDNNAAVIFYGSTSINQIYLAQKKKLGEINQYLDRLSALLINR